MMSSSVHSATSVSLDKAAVQTIGIILAAGKGTRMKSSLPKVAHKVLGKPMLFWAVGAMFDAGIRQVTVVLSPLQNDIRKELVAWFESTLSKDPRSESGNELLIAIQEEAKGTGHATFCGFEVAMKAIKSSGLSIGMEGINVLVGFGDTPAVTNQTYLKFLHEHQSQGAAVTVMGFVPDSNQGYGRIVLSSNSQFLSIREEKDCTVEEKKITLCNSGFLCANALLLEKTLPQLRNNNASAEYYLTDVPAMAIALEKPVAVFFGPNDGELLGVNSQAQLAGIAAFMQQRILDKWMAEGVQFLNPSTVYLEQSVTFERDVVVEPCVYLAGKTHVKCGQRIEFGSRIVENRKTNYLISNGIE
jgi:bifunctional UDP-N-acetylglucosamine pyrophosphorylase / glucosamine-1-phosphate N-acetyltransferase